MTTDKPAFFFAALDRLLAAGASPHDALMIAANDYAFKFHAASRQPADATPDPPAIRSREDALTRLIEDIRVIRVEHPLTLSPQAVALLERAICLARLALPGDDQRNERSQQ